MKSLFCTALLTLCSAAALAQPINLQSGSSIVINGDVVSCQGPATDSLAPACTIRQDGYYYRVYAGDTISQSYTDFDSAINGVKAMREAGLCR